VTDTAIENLQQAIKSAAGDGSFALDAAFLTQGLNDDTVAVPTDYDKNLQAAFQVTQASDFLVQVSPSDVGSVSDNSFTVTKASIPFLGSPLNASTTMVFALQESDQDLAETTQTLVVQINSAPANWTWTDSFAFMGGWPFNQLSVSAVQFIFSTSEGKYPWADESGKAVKAGEIQNFFSKIPLPDVVEPVLVLFDGLSAPTGNLDLTGALDMSQYNGETVLFPSGELTAALSDTKFTLLYLQVVAPQVSLSIPAAESNGNGGNGNGKLRDGDDDNSGQSATLSVASKLEIDTDVSPYLLQVQLTPPLDEGGSTCYKIGLTVAEEETPLLTPATIVSLVGVNDSYFSAVPPVLQEFLTFVGLQGLTLSGALGNSPTINSVAVEISSNPNTSWTAIPDPTGQLSFTITEFALQWSIQTTTNDQDFTFSTKFTLAPAIFKSKDGQENGIFSVQFTSGLKFYATFDGTAQLSDFLSTLTGGIVSLPSSIETSLSNISLNLDYSAQSFSFSSDYQVSLAFLEVGGEPILSISDGQVSISAQSPTQDSSNGNNLATGPSSRDSDLVLAATANDDNQTVWTSEISGLLAVGSLAANVTVTYDSTKAPARWTLKAALAEAIEVQTLIEQFFDPTGSYTFPDFLPGTLTINTFTIDATIPSGEGDLSTSYGITTTFDWLFELGQQNVTGVQSAAIEVKYDGSKDQGKQFSGSASGTWVYSTINLELVLGYQFQGSSNSILYLVWQGFRAEYQTGNEQIAFTLKGWSLGTLIQALVRTLGNPYFTLPSPWNLLDQVSLDGLSIMVSLENDQTNRLSASYTLSSALNLGFIKINRLVFYRDTTGKVKLAIDGDIPKAFLDSTSSDNKQKLENLTNQDQGQDVDDLPTVPGQGQTYFKLFLLVLGQRIGITGSPSFDSVQDVITALQNVPSTTGNTNPVNPNENEGNPSPGLPYYDQGNNWLIAGHLGLLKIGDDWTVDLQFVFNDPNLYGLRLALAGTKAGGLAGLVIDVLYKKITDDVGVFQIDFTFPDAVRNLNFGAISVTLPDLSLAIYTNGDFLVDIGFPYNLDFSRSFSIAAIIPPGIPVLGSGGLYFGKLSNATATAAQVPQTNQGTFNPVIVFGLGLQLGLGYNFTKGPLSAGFALTFFGIIEGVLAAWHPYDSTTDSALTSSDSALQSDYYFKLSGTFGVIGLLYGKIDFSIIQATVNVNITLSIQITYESYQDILLVATASVSITVKVKINLGLFSISVSLSFSATVSAQFVIGVGGTAPWGDAPTLSSFTRFTTRRATMVRLGPDATILRSRALNPRPKRVVLSEGTTVPTLHILISPQYTVLAPEDATEYSQQQGAFVCLLAIDAPDATSEDPNQDTSFDRLCASYFPWAIDALGQPSGDTVNLAAAATTVVSRQNLEDYITLLADNDNPPFTITDLLTFLQTSFTINIETPTQANTSGTRKLMEAGATLFPVFDGLSLSVPNPNGTGTKPITLETYTTANSAYRTQVSNLFAEVEAVIETQNQEQLLRTLALEDDDESMAALIFVDTFAMIGRQLLQAALNSLDSYAYHLQSGNSIQLIIAWANNMGNDLQPDDIGIPNQNHPLSSAIVLTISNLVYTLQAQDTLQAIATRYSDPNTNSSRWTTTPAQLIENNRTARVLQPNVELTIQVDNHSVLYTTVPGDSFQAIAEAVGITLEQLATQTALYNVANLLLPAQELAISAIAYTTTSDDTLNSVAALFATTVANLTTINTDVPNLFSPDAEDGMITLANLSSLAVSDLWTAIEATDQVAQTAGMVSRFLLFGLRLPKQAGLGLSDEFLYSNSQQGYGLYQLTGQQFPTPASIESYEIILSRADTAHGVSLSFIEFNGVPGTSVEVDLTQAYNSLSMVLTWAQAGNFQPSPSLQVLPLSSRSPKAFAANNFSLWSTSDVSTLQSLTDRTNSLQSDTSQPQPILWPLPSSLLSQVKTRQTALSSQFSSLSDIIPLMPQLVPQVGSTSPASNTTTYSDLNHWAWTTRVDFEIKRLPAPSSNGTTTNTGAGATPSGPALLASLPNVYEMVGPSSQDSVLLEQLLSAMDALGEGLVSAVFLLYEQSGSNLPKLATLSTQEFLAFITQTNLSTETNPELSPLFVQATADPPRGIANSPAQFIKLLWELSVVRSGGYYLYYEVVDSGDGLPASIFDTSGSATLSLVVTYQTQGNLSFGNTVLNFVNGLVSTDAIDTNNDVVQLKSQSAEGQSAALQETETLASLSAIYGAGPGRLAEVNSSLALVSNKVIPMQGLVRQITDPATTLADLATYYSVGASTPISAQEIQNFNPGVTLELGAVFYIPPINYIISPATTPGTAPGNTFAEIAAYYGVSVDEIATNARLVSGIFAAQTTLSINTELFDLRSTLGPGNIGIALQRVNLGEPNLNDNDYAKEYLYSLYNTLSAGLEQNVFFKASSLGLPFGPENSDNPEPDDAFTSHARVKIQRRERLRAGTEASTFNYSQSLGFGKFSLVNAAPSSPPSGLPPQSENPYIGVGSTAQVALRWQDIFGNTTITPFRKVPSNYTGALNGSAATILYNDRLIGVGGWSNTQVSYIYSGTAGAPVLNLNFVLDTSSYEGNQNQAQQDLALYQQVYFQLHQDYSNLSESVPGVTGQAVSMSLSNTLLREPNLSLSDTQADVVRTFVSACVQYLTAIINDTEANQPTATLSLTIDSLDTVATGNVLPLNVSLTFERQAQLTEPTVAALNEGLSVTSTILPQPDTNGNSYQTFATAFEEAFVNSQWSLKVGEGLVEQGKQSSDQRNQQLWAVRFGKQKGQGIYFELGTTPSYYAPKPIAKSLESQTVQLEDYTTGEQVTSSFTGVDQNLWFQTCLDAMDSFLSASYAPSAFILDKLEGTQDPLKDGYLGKILQAKQSLADSISSTVTPILSTSAGDSASIAAAQEKFLQQLLNQLGAAYNAGAVVLFGLSDVSGAPASNPSGPPNLYGQPRSGTDSDTGNQNYTLSSAKLPLGQVPLSDQGKSANYDPRLTFVFTSKNVLSQAYVPLDLNLEISHLEFERTAVPGIEGYVQSQWLAFVNGPFKYTLGTSPSNVNVPVVDRALPTPPSVQQQLAQQLNTSPNTPDKLTKWNYSFEYLYSQAAQDAVQVTLKLNQSEQSALNSLSAESVNLFQALAQFVTAYPDINRDLNQYLTKIDGETPDQETLQDATKAVSAFEKYITAVADAYSATLNPQPLLAVTDSLELVEVTFEIVLESNNNNARIDLLNLAINGKSATWNPTSSTISNGQITLPAPVVEIDSSQYQPEAVNPPPQNVDIAYLYTEKSSETADTSSDVETTYLSYTTALGIPLRTIKLPDLDVLAYQNAWSSIFVQRNKILFPSGETGVSTTDDFLFQTPVVKFVAPIVPRLVYSSFNLNQTGDLSLEAALNLFYQGDNSYNGLFYGGNGQTTVEVSMTTAYSYQLLPNVEEIPRILLPISLLPPTLTPVNPSSTPTFNSTVAASVDDWRTQNQPTVEGNPQVNFKLQVFSTSSAKQPLLTVNDLIYLVTDD